MRLGNHWVLLSYLLVFLTGGGILHVEFDHIEQANAALARERGQSLFQLVELARHWNALHGEVYVPVSEIAQPNEYLEHPRRDVRTEAGQLLTMINPAYMTRQFAEIAAREGKVQLHITSLKPIRPSNAPDEWEREALTRFENKTAVERLEWIPGADQPQYRYMAPLLVKEACLKCHQKQGYQLGDVRGGISITLPATADQAIMSAQKLRASWQHGLSALLVALLLHLVFWRTMRHIRSLRELAAEQEQLVEERTRDLQGTNERLSQEIRERQQAEQRLRISDAALRSVSEGVMVTDAQNRILDTNPAFTRITGYAREEVLGKPPKLLASGRHDQAFYQAMWAAIKTQGQWAGEIWNRKKDGLVYPQWLSISEIPRGDQSISAGQYVATLMDITQRKAAEEALKQQAQTDALTHLPNRSLLHDRLAMVLCMAERYQELFAVIYIDLDYFKEVNDTLGHAAGDEVLRQAAQRMSAVIRESDTLARVGGDEFTLLLPKLTSCDEGRQIAARVVATLAHPFLLETGPVQISGSLGVAFYPANGRTLEPLLEAADQALYQVKRKGRNGYEVAASQEVLREGETE